jgi:hypothetical protein
VSSDQGNKLKASIEAINEKRKADELRVQQQTTIKQLNDDNKMHIEKTLIAESKIKNYLHEMEEQKKLLESKQFVKVVEKAIRVEVMVPTIVEKIYEVDRYIERPSLAAKLELTKRERAELKKMVRTEVNDEIMELEQNVLAY